MVRAHLPEQLGSGYVEFDVLDSQTGSHMDAKQHALQMGLGQRVHLVVVLQVRLTCASPDLLICSIADVSL